MLPVTLTDLAIAAEWVARHDYGARPALVHRLIARADAAEAYRRACGRLSSRLGNGTLMAATLAEAGGNAALGASAAGDRRFLQALGLLTQVLAPDKADVTGRWSDGCERTMLEPDTGRGALMARKVPNIAPLDPVWQRICEEAAQTVQDEPLLGSLIHNNLLHHPTFERALSFRFSLKLASAEMSEQILREIADEAYGADPSLGEAGRADVVAVYDRDPACDRFIQPVLFFKGYQAVQAYRVAHWLWTQGRRDMARFVQMRISEVFGVDIHPAARIGKGIMIDHAHSIVIGETAVVGDNVSMLHSVTLGGTGKQDGDRHPKIGNGVMIGAGAKVLGNIKVGHCSRIAAGSVVLSEVPPCKTVAGVPARIVGEAGCDQPAMAMDQRFNDEA